MENSKTVLERAVEEEMQKIYGYESYPAVDVLALVRVIERLLKDVNIDPALLNTFREVAF